MERSTISNKFKATHYAITEHGRKILYKKNSRGKWQYFSYHCKWETCLTTPTIKLIGLKS